MSPEPSDQETVRRVLAGDRRALSRTITEVENRTDRGGALLSALYPHTGKAHTVGITGSAGSGKSTLTAALARGYRRLGRSVGVVAVDPTSPFTRGAILGDRIRMQDLTADPGIYVRSMATRGAVGGLAAATAAVAAVLDAAGRERILIETVGAGQDEVEIAGVAETTLVVNTPGMGDDIQAIKAGIMEVANVLVVNKADLPGADAVAGQLRALLSFAPEGEWKIPIISVSALKEEGIDALLDAIERHASYLRASEAGARESLTRAQRQILAAVQAEVASRLQHLAGPERLDALAEQVIQRRLDPRGAALRLLEGIG